MDAPSLSPPSPSYRIFRDKHGIPQFEPRRGSRALKDALTYAFPTLETEMQLMQAALKKFFDSERGSTFICELPENNLQLSIAKRKEIDSPFSPTLRSRKSSRTSSQAPSLVSSRAPSRASSRCETPVSFVASTFEGGVMTTWMLDSGRELEKRKKTPYDAAKRRRVAENRGNACEKHRVSKTACDPDLCPQNKLHTRGQRGRLMSLDAASPCSEATSVGSMEATKSNGTSSLSGSMEYSMQTPPVTNTNMTFITEDPVSWNDQSSLINSFQGPSAGNTSTNSFTWNQSPHSEPSSKSTPESNLAQSFTPLLHPQSHSTHQHSLFTFNEEPNEMLSTSLLEESVDIPSQLDGDFSMTSDPFMGWGNKNVSQPFDNYGWVLDHVGTL